ncbi:MAG: hemerythrin domain-containing protein [Elainellaceae cyanobacterium]
MQGVDFFRTYADATHHGKEEDVLFRELRQKDLSDEHQAVLDELIAEHEYARAMVTGLLDQKQAYVDGDTSALNGIIEHLESLIEFYPAHIDKEDNHFFWPCMQYVSDDESDAMLHEFSEVDRQMIHDKYRQLVEQLEP